MITRRQGLFSGLSLAAMLPLTVLADETPVALTKPGAILGEGPLWSPKYQSVFWVDILGKKLHRYGLADRAQQSWDMPDIINWIVEREKGGFVVSIRQTVHFLTLDPFSLTPVAQPEKDKPGNRLNDAKVDARGRLWTGTMDLAFKDRTAALYRIDPDLSVHTMDTDYVCTNGPAFSRDGKILYHNETHDGIVYAFDLAADGSLSNKRVFTKFEAGVGLPDGCTVDADDGLWVSHYGGGRISRYFPDGRKDFDIMLPAQCTTSLTFCGNDLDRMVVTSAAQEHRPGDVMEGTLFEIPKSGLRGHKGLPVNKFAG
ncbi:SMP-30/gluconolactonase/LRE family protein [Asticcacaulis solisilvae]|uniref:SMP-30/gluconolactonase/LRE family protein n=1 Tax=Asticcacaulis solisilvae TaxID=1217274 RepID=UPI003FD73912